MLSRENRVFAASWLLLGAFVALVGYTGVGVDPVVWFVAITGLGFVAPQAYLAAVDASVPARSRIRVAVLMTIVIAALGFDSFAGRRAIVVSLLCGVVLGALLGYEFTSGYRDAARAA